MDRLLYRKKQDRWLFSRKPSATSDYKWITIEHSKAKELLLDSNKWKKDPERQGRINGREKGDLLYTR